MSVAGMELAAGVVGMCLAGYYIDQRYGFEPWGLVIGGTMGIIGGLYNLIREALSLNRARDGSPGAIPQEPSSKKRP